MMMLSLPLLAARIDEMMAADLAGCRIDGAAVSVTCGGRTVLRRYYGAAREGMIFRLASMTKPITAAAVLLLAAEGQLQLDDPVSLYLPEYAALRLGRLDSLGRPADAGPSRVPLTIRHLLTHTGGLLCGPLGAAQYAGFPPSDQASLAAAVAAYPRYPLSFEPGSQAAYSAVAGFDVLARIVELVSRQNYA
ncbi:MAG: serine hydrolase domain-containing protein, partial [Christensenellaceae bacterium]